MAVAFACTVMLAVDGRVVSKASGSEVRRRLVGISLYSAKETDPRFFQGILCAGTDAAANQDVYVFLLQQGHQSAVASPVARQQPGSGDSPVRDLIELELLTFCRSAEKSDLHHKGLPIA